MNAEELIEDRPISSFQIAIVVLCGVTAALEGFNAQAIGYVAPAINKDWNLHAGDLGPAIALGLFGLMAGALFIAPLADRIGRRRILIGSTVLFGLGTLATAWAWSLTSLTLLRILTGLGIGGAMPNALALTSEFMPKRRRAFMLVMLSNGFNIGSLVGGVLAAQFTQTLGWRAVFVTGGLLSILLVPALMFLPESLNFVATNPSARARDQLAKLVKRLRPDLKWSEPIQILVSGSSKDGKNVRALFARGLGLTSGLLWVIFFMSLLDVYMLVSWLPTALHVAGAPPTTAIVAGILLQAGGIVASLPIGWSLDRFGVGRTLGPAYLLAAICVAGIGVFYANIPLTMMIVFGAGCGLTGSQCGANAVATISYPAHLRSTGTGWALGIGRIGSIVGPAVGGILLNAHVSISNIFYLSALPALFATVAIIAFALHTKGKSADYSVGEGVVRTDISI